MIPLVKKYIAEWTGLQWEAFNCADHLAELIIFLSDLNSQSLAVLGDFIDYTDKLF